MDRMRSWNSSEYESCGLQPYEISNAGEKRRRKRKELVNEVCMSEGRTYGKGHWIGLEQGFYLFRIDYVNKRREGGSFACGIKKGNQVFFRHVEDSATFVTMSCYFLFFFLKKRKCSW